MSHFYTPGFLTFSNGIEMEYCTEMGWIIMSSVPNQSAFTCSKLTIETLEQGVKYVQSLQ